MCKVLKCIMELTRLKMKFLLYFNIPFVSFNYSNLEFQVLSARVG